MKEENQLENVGRRQKAPLIILTHLKNKASI
jgi:hypothetical protein